MKKFFGDFKKFISRGNILDLAVGVIVGGAFSAIVTALTNKVIRPLVNWILAAITGGNGLASACTFLKTVYQLDAAGNPIIDAETGKKVIDLANSIYIDWGAFITAVIDFLIIAFTIFLILRAVMKSKEFMKDASEKAKKVTLNKAERKELKEAGVNIKDRNAVKAYFEAKEKEAEEKAKLEAEEKARAEEEFKKNNPSQEELLKEIRDLLKAQNAKEQASE